MPDLRIEDLTVEYEGGDYVVRPLSGLTLHAQSGQLVVLLGPSGSGKTTLLSCLAGILAPTSGTVRFGDVEVSALQGRGLAEYRRRTVGVAFQAFNLISSLSALENVAAPLRLAGIPGRDARRRAEELLTRVNLADRMHHLPAKLSGGQQQRVAIARAMAHDPPLVLADEPTAHLDYVQAEAVVRLIRELAAPGRLVVVATHDERMIPLADRVVELVPRALDVGDDPKRVELPAGRVLFEMGDRSDYIYVVERGAIEVFRRRPGDGEEPVAAFGPGEYFGELGPLLGFPRTASARARRRSVLVGYSPAQFRRIFGSDPRVGSLLGTGVAPRSRGGDDGTGRADLLRLASRGVARAAVWLRGR